MVAVDRRKFIAGLGGAAAVAAMLETAVAAKEPGTARTFPTVAELEAQIETRTFRRGVGSLFAGGSPVKRLTAMPEKPTLLDHFNLGWTPANHALQSAALAKKNGMSEEIILACLLHDVIQSLIKTDHGERSSSNPTCRRRPPSPFAIIKRCVFGVDYVPPPHIQASYKFLKNHKWYVYPRQVTVNDLYAFDCKAKVSVEPFIDIIGRHFKQPKEGLGNDNSPMAHMWRSMARPDSPL